MEYQIVVESDPFRMAECVNDMCKDGWMPVGSHHVAFEPGQIWYYSQAVVRKTPNTKEALQNDTQQLQAKIADCALVIENSEKGLGSITKGAIAHRLRQLSAV